MTHSTIRNDFEQKLNAIENSATEEDTVSSTQTLALQAKAEELEERLASTEKSLMESNQLIKTMEKNNLDENKEQNDQCKYYKNIKKANRERVQSRIWKKQNVDLTFLLPSSFQTLFHCTLSRISYILKHLKQVFF